MEKSVRTSWNQATGDSDWNRTLMASDLEEEEEEEDPLELSWYAVKIRLLDWI